MENIMENIDEESAAKELKSLSLNTKRFLADQLGNKIVSIKITNEMSIDPLIKRERIGEFVREFFTIINRYKIFSED